MVRCLSLTSGRGMTTSSEPSLNSTVPVMRVTTEALVLFHGASNISGE